jgi:hypothetical protein
VKSGRRPGRATFAHVLIPRLGPRLAPRLARVLAPILLLLTACADTGTIRASEVVGPGGGAFTVLIDTPAVPAIRCATERYLRGAKSGIAIGAGAPDHIVRTIKYGLPGDVVILPAGPALDRVRNELATPPLSVVTISTTTFWAGAVTDRGLRYIHYLAGRYGRAVLESAPCADLT